jgi:hypothetical protein
MQSLHIDDISDHLRRLYEFSFIGFLDALNGLKSKLINQKKFLTLIMIKCKVVFGQWKRFKKYYLHKDGIDLYSNRLGVSKT